MHLYSDETLIKKAFETTPQPTTLNNIHQRVLIIHNEPIDDDLENMIENMMKACGLSANDYFILSLIDKDTSWKNLYVSTSSIKEIIIFGALENQLALNFQLNFNIPIQFDQRVWIKTHSLNEIKEEQIKKANFWNQALKPYFTR